MNHPTHHSGARTPLRIYVHEGHARALEAVSRVATEGGHMIVDSLPSADIAVAPALRRILSRDEYSAPRLGTLVFHPSILPRHRGRDAIKWAYRMNESFTGVTWFWCDGGIDTGDVCEQDVLPLNPSVRPSEFYDAEVIPALARTLIRALDDLSRGIVRRRPQYEPAATYEQPIRNAS